MTPEQLFTIGHEAGRDCKEAGASLEEALHQAAANFAADEVAEVRRGLAAAYAGAAPPGDAPWRR
jgi:hypothetical protein